MREASKLGANGHGLIAPLRVRLSSRSGAGPWSNCVREAIRSVYRVLHDYRWLPMLFERYHTGHAHGTGIQVSFKTPVYKGSRAATRDTGHCIPYGTEPNCRSRISDGASLQSAGPERIGSNRTTEPAEQQQAAQAARTAPKPSTMLHAHATMWYKSASRFARNKGLERPPATRQSYHADDEGPITMELPPRD